jgi:hypothetical protein
MDCIESVQVFLGLFLVDRPYHTKISSMAFSEYPLFFSVSLIEETFVTTALSSISLLTQE